MTWYPKEKKLKNKEREKGLKPKIHDKDSAKDLLSFIKKTLNQNKAVDITEINVDQSFSEFEKILIASGSSNRQVVALAEKVQEGVKGLFRINCKVEGKENADWVLLDFGAVIVHIFKPEVREYYQIEKMWKGHLTQISS
tara:strand:+ start:75 stop:494 length:420 start_codon:yes stop_codon:yes gene_type:complete